MEISFFEIDGMELLIGDFNTRGIMSFTQY